MQEASGDLGSPTGPLMTSYSPMRTPGRGSRALPADHCRGLRALCLPRPTGMVGKMSLELGLTDQEASGRRRHLDWA